MSFTFTPGQLLVDETDVFGERVHLPPSERVNWPDTTRWLTRVEHWLNQIARTAVGRVLLESMTTRPGSPAPVVKIVRSARDLPEAYTDGILAPHTTHNPGNDPIIYITYTPSDARTGPMSLNPMHHPGPVLTHELMHAYMSIHSLNTTSAGGSRPIGSWSSAAYPNHNEFCATTVQNMLLSETGALLADGYNSASADDPHITTSGVPGASPGTFGMPASSTLDMAGFVATYRQPLDFLVAALPRFTARLAALTSVPFNPFATLRSGTGGSGSTTRRGGASGAARVPGSH
jgi:hypothetical protein